MIVDTHPWVCVRRDAHMHVVEETAGTAGAAVTAFVISNLIRLDMLRA